MLKRLMKSRFAGKIASFLIGAYIHFVYATSSWTITGIDQAERAADRGNGLVVLFWHGRLMMAPVMRKQTARRFFMLISAHRDGDIIADSVKSFGLEFIRGSTANPKKRDSDKGGIVASAKMVEALSGRAYSRHHARWAARPHEKEIKRQRNPYRATCAPARLSRP